MHITSLTTLAAGLLVVAVATALALLVRASWRGLGSAMLAGAIAGVLLGPSVLGHLAPEQYERFVLGGAEVRASWETTLIEQRAEIAALEHLASDPEVILGRRAALEAATAEAQSAIDAERRTHQRPLRVLMIVVVFAVLLGSRTHGRPTPAAPIERPDPVATSTIGLWSAALPGGLAFIFAQLWWTASWPEALAAGAVVAVGPWALGTMDRGAAEHAEIGGAALIAQAGRVASVLALIAAGVALFMAQGAAAIAWIVALFSFVVAWRLPTISSRFARFVVDGVMIPGLVALVTMQLDVRADVTLWPLVAYLLLSGDGRWLGAQLGAMILGGRGSLRTLRLVLGAMACGPTQLALVASMKASELLPSSIALAALAGAIAIELLAPFRGRMAQELEHVAPPE